MEVLILVSGVHILVDVVKQELGGIVTGQQRTVWNLHVTIQLHQCLDEHRIDGHHAIHIGGVAGPLPNGGNVLRHVIEVRVHLLISNIEGQREKRLIGIRIDL